MHCGTPAAEQAKTCMMCHKPVDSLPLDRSIFSGSWVGIALGVLIVVGLVLGFNRYREAPAPAVAQAPTATATATPTFTPFPTHTSTPKPPTATPTITPSPTATPRIHIIEAGQGLFSVAERYGVPLEVLMSYNDLTRDSVLRVGQEIRIPPAVSPNVGLRTIPEGDELPPQMVYVIQSGDTLSDIAYNNGTTVDTLARYNPDVDLDLIYPGQEIIVPLSTPTPTSTPTPLPTPTRTPGPDFPAPVLLSPADGQTVGDEILLLTWLAPRLLAPDEFYVVQLVWPNGQTADFWGQSTALRLTRDSRPAAGTLLWAVSIKRKTAAGEVQLSPPGPVRSVEWR